jgi:hypothetical protein
MFNSAFTAQTSIQSSGFGTDPFGATADFGSGSGFAEFGVFPSSGTSSQVRCCMTFDCLLACFWVCTGEGTFDFTYW